MTETFSWKVEVDGTSGSGEFAMSSAQFGDGYAQDTPAGINSERQKWNVSRSGYDYQLQPIVDFIREHGGTVAFLWKPPLGPIGYYKCKKWQLSPVSGTYLRFNMDFEQTYIPT
jgi:phage-related protein